MVFILMVESIQRGLHPWGSDLYLNMNPSSSVTPAFVAISCIGLGTEWHEQSDLRCSGIADPFADDLITGRGVVLGRAATKLRSIETQPLTGGSISHCAR